MGNKDAKVDFKYDPWDLSRIYVICPDRSRYLTVFAKDQELTANLSIYKQRELSRLNKSHRKENLDMEIARAKGEILDIVQDAGREKKKREKLIRSNKKGKDPNKTVQLQQEKKLNDRIVVPLSKETLIPFDPEINSFSVIRVRR